MRQCWHMGWLVCQSGTSELVLSYRSPSTFATINPQPALVLSKAEASAVRDTSCMVILEHIATDRAAISTHRTWPSHRGHHLTNGLRESSANRPMRSLIANEYCLALCELLRIVLLSVRVSEVMDHARTYIWENSPHHIYCEGVVNSTHVCAVQHGLRRRRRMSRGGVAGKGCRCW
jgi:hypothetical protein